MSIRVGLSILFQLCMMVLFFVGLVWVVRLESSLKMLAGIAMMLFTVPLSYEVGAAIAGHHRISLKSFQKMSKSAFPVVGPIVLLFVFLSSLDYFSRTGNAWVFGLWLLVTPPLLSVLIDVMSGEIARELVAISEAYSQALLHMIARLIYLAGGLLLLVSAVVAVVTLFITLGDLIRQGLFFAGPFTEPVLCRFSVFQLEHCTTALLAWHTISLITLSIVWRYGQQILHRIDSLFAKL